MSVAPDPPRKTGGMAAGAGVGLDGDAFVRGVEVLPDEPTPVGLAAAGVPAVGPAAGVPAVGPVPVGAPEDGVPGAVVPEAV